ncbi:MAG: ATP-dependent Clp protease adaptor ClpS [Bacteroidales bacterium]|jgi:ATP-dependent Clp protease adaptor protein ClpS|nr:ATP-dependent Clp protease adaptor ClpS [Bacteroidales bacterium]
MGSRKKTEKQEKFEINEDSGRDYLLILHNDDVHDFNFVIDSLVDICNHDSVQAEQCTFLVHYNGKCDVKKGKYRELKIMHDQLQQRGLIVTLN